MSMPVRTCQIQSIDSTCGSKAARRLEVATEFDHLARSLRQLRRYLARGKHGVDEKEYENSQNRWLRDVIVLEHARQPVEASLTGENGTDKDHVPPHKEREHEPAAAAQEFVGELSRCLN